MSTWAAFLRGVNLGKRQMKMAELRTCLEEAGFQGVRTILASGNVRFEADGSESTLKHALDRQITARFGFLVEVVLRSADALRAMLDDHPFVGLDPDADMMRYVVLFDAHLPTDAEVASLPRDTEILRIDRREIYFAAYRQPNGRYTEHAQEVLAPLYARLGKGALSTTRNWNTIEKILA